MKLIISALLILSIITIYLGSKSLSYNLFKDSLYILITSSSILFAILGVWIALLYPQEFKDLKNGKKNETDQANDLKKLIKSMFYCVITICFILILSFTSIFLKIFITPENLSYFQILSGFILALITIVQIYCYLTILLPLTTIDTHLTKKRHDQNIMDKFSPNKKE